MKQAEVYQQRKKYQSSVQMRQVIMINLPEGLNNPRIVLSYHGEIRIYVDTSKEMRERCIADPAENKKMEDILQAKKMEILETALGYKIQKLEDIVPHDEYKGLSKS